MLLYIDDEGKGGVLRATESLTIFSVASLLVEPSSLLTARRQLLSVDASSISCRQCFSTAPSTILPAFWAIGKMNTVLDIVGFAIVFEIFFVWIKLRLLASDTVEP